MSEGSPPISIPRITTERLLLREVQSRDFASYEKFLSDPEATRFLAGVVDGRTAWRLMASLAGGWVLVGAGWWAIEIRQTGEFVGVVGAFFRETSLPLGPDSDIELGWSLFPPYWRKGYATEAARAALAYAFARHDVRRAIAHIDPTNIPSIKVAEAIGMPFEGEVDFYGKQCARHALARRH